MVRQHLKQLFFGFCHGTSVGSALAHVVWFDYKDENTNLFGHPESGPETFDVKV